MEAHLGSPPPSGARGGHSRVQALGRQSREGLSKPRSCTYLYLNAPPILNSCTNVNRLLSSAAGAS